MDKVFRGVCHEPKYQLLSNNALAKTPVPTAQYAPLVKPGLSDLHTATAKYIFLSPPFCAIHFVGDCTLSLKCIHMSELQVCDSIPATHISRHINSITQVRQLILVNLLLHIKPGLSTTVNNGLYILSYCLESSSYLDVKKCTCHQLQPFQNSCVHSFYGIS